VISKVNQIKVKGENHSHVKGSLSGAALWQYPKTLFEQGENYTIDDL
jgi:hypothetical protein